MAHVFRITTAATALLLATPAAAYYAEPSMPPGTGGGAGGWTYRPNTPTPTGGGRINGGSAGITVGGQTISRGVSWGIGRGAAGAVARGIVKGGLIGAGWGLAGWAAEQCVHVVGGGLYLRCGDPDKPYLPGELVYVSDRLVGRRFGSAAEACNASAEDQAGPGRATGSLVAVGNDGNRWNCYSVMTDGGTKFLLTFVYKAYLCEGPPQTYSQDGRCPMPNKEGKETDEETAIGILSDRLPPTIPPGIDIPVDTPVWNPTPGPNPRPKPVVTPIGDPVPNLQTGPAPDVSPVAPTPGTDTQTQRQRITWTQPAVEIVHSPTEDQPLRLEVRPIDVPVEGPNARIKPDQDQRPEPAPATGTGGGPVGTDTGSNNPPAEQPGLCEQYPDILACEQLDDIEAEELQHETAPVEWQMAPGFARAGHCPADRRMTMMGKTVTWSWGPICNLATGVRPVVVAFAALAAVLIIVGASRRD